jgi:uridine phosphorylase
LAEQPQRHLRITTGAMPRYCLLPGDPARAERIAARLDRAEETIRNREFLGFRGTAGGVPLGVCSTGIGGPSASIALEELANVGVDTFIRVGSAGGRQETIPVGSLVVVTAAHRGEGTSRAYLPPEFPAVAHERLLPQRRRRVEERGGDPEVGCSSSPRSCECGRGRCWGSTRMSSSRA